MEKWKIFLAALGGFFASLGNHYGTILILLITIIVFDFVTGMIKAKVTGEEIKSGKSKVGLFKKAAMLMCFLLGIFMDYFIPIMLSSGIGYTVGFNLPFGLIMGCYVIITEVISVIENLDASGVNVPNFILNALNKSKDAIDSGTMKGD